jgi:hypothetical protein
MNVHVPAVLQDQDPDCSAVLRDCQNKKVEIVGFRAVILIYRNECMETFE